MTIEPKDIALDSTRSWNFFFKFHNLNVTAFTKQFLYNVPQSKAFGTVINSNRFSCVILPFFYI